jgi:Anti-sigma-K factor rskA
MAMAFAAALIGIIALGGVVLVGRYLQVRSDKVAAERQLSAVLSCAGRPDCAVVQLKAQGKSSASAVALVQAGTVQLVVNGLPPTGRDSSYVLWAGLPGGGVTGVGRFVISGGGRHIISPDLKSAVVVSRGRLLAVTKEPGRQIPAAPSTKPILAGTAA